MNSDKTLSKTEEPKDAKRLTASDTFIVEGRMCL